MNCPPGSYGDNVTNTCIECPIGYYQDVEGKPECQICAKNRSTAITGAKNISDCKRKKFSNQSFYHRKLFTPSQSKELTL